MYRRAYQSAGDGFQDDAVEVYLDANNQKGTNYLSTDYHYGFYFEARQAIVVEAHNATNGVVMGRRPEPMPIIQFEAKFPWSTLGQSVIDPVDTLEWMCRLTTKTPPTLWHGIPNCNGTTTRIRILESERVRTGRLSPSP